MSRYGQGSIDVRGNDITKVNIDNKKGIKLKIDSHKLQYVKCLYSGWKFDIWKQLFDHNSVVVVDLNTLTLLRNVENVQFEIVDFSKWLSDKVVSV